MKRSSKSKGKTKTNKLKSVWKKEKEATKTDSKQEPVQLFPNSQPNSITAPKPTNPIPSVIKDSNAAYFNTDETPPKIDFNTDETPPKTYISTPLQDWTKSYFGTNGKISKTGNFKDNEMPEMMKSPYTEIQTNEEYQHQLITSDTYELYDEPTGTDEAGNRDGSTRTPIQPITMEEKSNNEDQQTSSSDEDSVHTFNFEDTDEEEHDNKQLQTKGTEKEIEWMSKSMGRLNIKARTIEDSIEEYQLHPDYFSSDRKIREQIRGKRSKLMDKLWEMDEQLNTQRNEISKLNKAKYAAFDMIRGIKIKMNEIVEEVEQHNSDILRNRNNIYILNQTMTSTKQEHRRILSKLESHDLKINASNALPSKPWMLLSDTDRYPILTIYQSSSKFSKFAPMIQQINLQGDKISNVRQFYENIDVTIMTSLSTMKFLPEYKDLTTYYVPEKDILPMSTHPQYDDAYNAYRQYSRTLLLHLQKKKTVIA